MAFRQEAAEQLWQELHGGYNLNAKLRALLDHPLDMRGQEAAVALSQELSRVFMVSLFTLKPGDSNRVAGVSTMAPEATITEGSVGQCTPAKDKRICSGETGLPHRKRTGEEVIKRKITSSPHKNGYRWKKYGQKNIQNSKFPRLYYRCTYSHERDCKAKKRVQQQDNSGSAHRPMFQVTLVNQHTCHQVVPSQDISNNATNLPATNSSTLTRNGTHFDPAVHVGDNAGLQNEIMTCALTTVIAGTPFPPPPVEVNQLSDSASYVSLRLPEMMRMGLEHQKTVGDMGFSWGLPFPPPVEAPAAPSSSSLSPRVPVEARLSYPVVGGNIQSMDPTTMEEMYCHFPCGPLFSPVAAQSPISGWDDVPKAFVAGWDTDTTSPWPHCS